MVDNKINAVGADKETKASLLFDYLNSLFIDFRGLLDTKLAISCYDLGNNNPYK